MTSYDPYEAPTRERSTRKYYREERRDDRDPRYVETRETYLSAYPGSRDLVRRSREDSDLSVEEVSRDFPPPGHSSREIRRARSAEPGYDDYYYDDRRSSVSGGRDRERDRDYYERDYDRRSSRKSGGAKSATSSSVYYEADDRKKARMLSKQEQIIAAVTGAALAVGGKELYDRREAHGGEIHRNLLASAALGAAGAFAGYQGTELYNKHKVKKEEKSTYVAYKGRDGKVSEYYSDEDEEGDTKEKKGHKNFLESALAAAGLGGAVKALTGGGSSHKDDRSDAASSRDDRRSRSRSRGRGEGANKIQKAAMASLIAGATEAFRVSKEPGAWKGEKAKRILTAAAGAATIDAVQSPDKAGSGLGLAESVIGGLLGNRVINGSRKNIEEDEKTGRSRSRSRARSSSRGGGGGGGGGGGVSGLAALATAGLGAVAGKKILDARERSRSRARSRDSYDSRDESPDDRHRRNRSRSRSVVDTARRSLAKIGIGNGPDDNDDDRRSRDGGRRDRDDYDDGPRGSRRHGGGRYDDDDYDDYDDDKSRGGHRDRGSDRDRRRDGGGRDDRSRGGAESDSDLGDSDEDRKRERKMKGKQLLTTGLAAVATIHAAHNVYQSMEKRNARQKAVREGRLSVEEARKLKSKALLQDAASVGIAALGIKGAISELKEVREMAHEMKEWKEEKETRHRKRLERLERQRKLAITDGSNGNGGGGGGGNRDEDYYRDDRRDVSQPDYGRQYARSDRYDDGPRYADGNPYASLPAPPPDGYYSSDRR